MQFDKYSKIILTSIAMLLAGILFKTDLIPTSQAQQPGQPPQMRNTSMMMPFMHSRFIKLHAIQVNGSNENKDALIEISKIKWAENHDGGSILYFSDLATTTNSMVVPITLDSVEALLH